MSNDKTGGAAFPAGAEEIEYGNEGMTLRDYFAGQVIGRLMRSRPHEAAALAYSLADAMIAEREKGGE